MRASRKLLSYFKSRIEAENGVAVIRLKRSGSLSKRCGMKTLDI